MSVLVSDAYVSVGPDLTRYRGLFALAAAVTDSPVGGGGKGGGTSSQKRELLEISTKCCDFHPSLGLGIED